METESSRELDTRKPILELQINPQTKISFLNLDQFSSLGENTLATHDIPIAVGDIVAKAERSNLKDEINTYSNTTNQPNWQRDLYGFVNRYVQGSGKHILEKMGVDRIANLTPKQAITLTVLLLQDLTKYNDDDTGPARKTRGEDLSTPTRADQKTVIQLLQEGIDNQKDPSWQGNGVCRNFAWMGKSIFESLRDSIPGGPLSTSYCLYDGGYAFAPKRSAKYQLNERRDASHAWDTYLVVSPTGNVEVTVADFTWATKSSGGDFINLDHTRERIEPVVFDLVPRIEGSDPGRKKELTKILEYYADNILHPGKSGYATTDEFRAFFATRALAIIKQEGATDIVPDSLKDAFVTVYKDLGSQASLGEITTLYEIMPGTATFDEVLGAYLKDLKLSNYNYHEVFSSNTRLQRAIFFLIKERPDFQSFIKESPAMRIRCREVGLGDLLPPFDPTKQIEDVEELRYLLNRSQYLKITSIERFHLVSEDRLASLYNMVKRALLELNPSVTQDQIDLTPGYTLLANFDYLVTQK